MIVAGCDVGASSVKLVVMEMPGEEILLTMTERIRKRNPVEVVNNLLKRVAEKGFPLEKITYLASTGEGEAVEQRDGHFYSMTCHARGARYFYPQTASVLDLGALHIRALKLDEKGKVVQYKMTSQCASGTGQFLENIARYLGVTIDEIPQLSLQATEPRAPSTICAVLAETDVINLVSQGVSLPNILRGIHDSVAQRAGKLLATFDVVSPLTLTGGLAMDAGLVKALEDRLRERDPGIEILTPEQALYAGAIGAALWGARRWEILQRREQAARVKTAT